MNTNEPVVSKAFITQSAKDTQIRAIVVSALYCFAAALTCRKEKITAGETENAAPMAQAVDDFCKAKGLGMVSDPPIADWQRLVAIFEAAEESRGLTGTPATIGEVFTKAINRFSIDSECNTPDFVLSNMLVHMLNGMREGLRARDLFTKPEKVAGQAVLFDANTGKTAVPFE